MDEKQSTFLSERSTALTEKIAEVVRKPMMWNVKPLATILAGADKVFEFAPAGDMGGFLVIVEANATNPNDILYIGLGDGRGGANIPLSPKGSVKLPHQPDEHAVIVVNASANTHKVCVIGFQGFDPEYTQG